MSGLLYTIESCSTVCPFNGVFDITLFLHFTQTKEDLEAAAEREDVAGGTDQQDSLHGSKDDVVGDFSGSLSFECL